MLQGLTGFICHKKFFCLDSDQNLEKALRGTWSDCSPDQLQTIAIELFSLVTRATHLIDVRTVALEMFSNDSKAAVQVLALLVCCLRKYIFVKRCYMTC